MDVSFGPVLCFYNAYVYVQMYTLYIQCAQMYTLYIQCALHLLIVCISLYRARRKMCIMKVIKCVCTVHGRYEADGRICITSCGGGRSDGVT